MSDVVLQYLLRRRGGTGGAVGIPSGKSSANGSSSGGGSGGGGGPPAPALAPRGFQPAPLAGRAPIAIHEAASATWVRNIADATNNILRGKLNATLNVTLASNVDHTTIIDPRIGAFSVLLFSPLTANAAAEQAAGTLYVSSLGDGTAMVAHANNAQTDRTFTALIIG